MLTTSLPGNKYFFQLGKLLLTKKPDVAQQLINDYLPVWQKPRETNLEKIPQFFSSFCKIENIKPSEYTGAVWKRSKMDKRRLFIAAIILLYRPGTRLVAKYISETLQQEPATTTRLIREVEFEYRKISEFKTRVNKMAKLLMKHD